MNMINKFARYILKKDDGWSKENYDEREAIYNSGEGALNFSGQTSGLTSV